MLTGVLGEKRVAEKGVELGFFGVNEREINGKDAGDELFKMGE